MYIDAPDNIVWLFKRCAKLYLLREPEVIIVNLAEPKIFEGINFPSEAEDGNNYLDFPFLKYLWDANIWELFAGQMDDVIIMNDAPETVFVTVKHVNIWKLMHENQCYELLGNKILTCVCYIIFLSWAFGLYFPSTNKLSTSCGSGYNNNRVKKISMLTTKCLVTPWLIELEMYFSSYNITRDEMKVLTVFDNIDGEVRKLLKYVNDEIAHASGIDSAPRLDLYTYESLKRDLFKLFVVGSTDVDTNRQLFSSRSQLVGESLSMFYSQLGVLFSLGYPDLSRDSRTTMMSERFISGISDANLTRDLRNNKRLDKTGKFDVLQAALDIQSLHPTKESPVRNQPVKCECSVKSTDATRVVCPTCSPRVSRVDIVKALEQQPRCYHCGCAGHYRRTCPLPHFPRPQWISNEEFNRVVTIRTPIGKHGLKREIRGLCNINVRDTNYVLDCGAKVTVIHARCITQDQRPAILKNMVHVLTANGDLLSILGVLYCRIVIGNTATYGDFYITDDEGMIEDCLLGMDVIMNCSLTRDLFETLLDRLEEVHPSEVKVETDVRSPIFDSTAFRIAEIGPGKIRNFEQRTFSSGVQSDRSQNSVDGSEFSMNEDLPIGGIHHDVVAESPIDLPQSNPNVCHSEEGKAFSDELIALFEGITATNLDDLMKKTNPAGLPDKVLHEIKVKENCEPVRKKSRGIPYAFREDFRKNILDMKKAGMIVDSKSPWCSPVKLVRKKDGSCRVCIDYRRVNAVTVGDAYPIPKIEDLFTYLSSARVFTTLDLASGYYKVPMNSNSQQFTAFACEYGYLSHIIRDGTMTTNPSKTEAVSGYVRPKTVKQLQSFLGLVSYYRKFIKGCASICSPLITLTKKGVEFVWTDDCESAFESLKEKLTSENNVLVIPSEGEQIRVEADASLYGVGGVLSVLRDQCWRPVSYFSRHLSRTEGNYSASEREMLAIVLAVERFKQYLYGRDFVILSDHLPLKYLLTCDVPEPRLGRLLSRLSAFTFEIIYRAGDLNGNADALSRMIDDRREEIGLTHDRASIVVNQINFKSASTNHKQLRDMSLKWMADLKTIARDTCGGRAPSCPFPAYKPHENSTELDIERDNIEQNSLFRQWDRIYMLNKNIFREYTDERDDTVTYQYIVPRSERVMLLKMCHDTRTSGHLGIVKTIDRITPHFYWPKIRQEIHEYVRSCVLCQQVKSPRVYNKAPLVPILTTRPGQLITTDIMGPIVVSDRGNVNILVVVDHFTKWVELFAMSSVTARDVAYNLLSVFFRFGIPETILSDQGRNFQSDLLAEIYEVLDIHKVRTTPYRPQCDGITERFNRTLQSMLTCFVADHQKDWDDLLPYVAFAYNTAVHSATDTTPFELTYGRKPKVPVDLIFSKINLSLHLTPKGYAEETRLTMQECFSRVIANRDTRMEKQKILYDRKCRAANFSVDDTVWLLDTATKVGKSKKLSRKWKGPYRILAKIFEGNFKIQPISGKGRKVVVHQDRLTKNFTRDVEKFDDTLDETAVADMSSPCLNMEGPNYNFLFWPEIEESNSGSVLDDASEIWNNRDDRSQDHDEIRVSSHNREHDNGSEISLGRTSSAMSDESEFRDSVSSILGLSWDEKDVDVDENVEATETPSVSASVTLESIADSELSDFKINHYFKNKLIVDPDKPLRRGTRERKGVVRFGQ